MPPSLKVAVVLGARPNVVKHYAFSRASKSRNINLVTLHTGQHFAPEMFTNIFLELGIPLPDYTFQRQNSTFSDEFPQLLEFIETTLAAESPDVTVVYGDVTSSLAGATASNALDIPVAHIETGIHTNDLNNPEEINRRGVELCAHTLFPHTKHAENVLLSEGYSKENVFLVGDIMKDALVNICSEHKIEPTDDGYLLVTFHRAENTDSPTRLRNICNALIRTENDIIFPVHPRTKQALEREGLWDTLQSNDHLTLLPPQSYIETIKLISKASKVVSDSGGLRREAFMMGKAVVSLIELNWVPEMVDAGWEIIAGDDTNKILEGIENFTPPKHQPVIFGNGQAAENIMDILIERYSLQRLDQGKHVNEKCAPLSSLNVSSTETS
ncbi:UDP-N-acetylglucosamine 2-epimerase (non-hydrolyzing) [Magnetovibrio sp. PR-2]|uniref:non-hydrolyzing UDP-N-acetylglucosamine 2-epimerase n=1 Tax=Magnetovibrio sp. PR-2 TaxID=3120356 RepID=UPI002FCE466C